MDSGNIAGVGGLVPEIRRVSPGRSMVRLLVSCNLDPYEGTRATKRPELLYRRRHSWRSALRFNQDHISRACPRFGLDWRVASLRRPATRLACKAGNMLRDSGRRRISASAGSAFRLVDLQGNRR